ncbi:MAG: PEP-CTERM sorting domain-containing protein [Gomphosphaeria aponina SAG 52.96 = DSM 107014]|uniref:PEP-CTERM sorting domain-containing protein n=1 Tax=Gomphosphaeria aponina SAG 52.96 = DSM 107014 TaxID=1521640 RepID=A0A941JUM8_9CHRO|nr:PEP-CTERM sorting domain-containing protein [Gomphosphaeria aponina SAG 52.96 = DSM 107014]
MKKTMKQVGLSLAVLTAVLTPGAARAASIKVVDWNTANWTGGGLNQTVNTGFGNIGFNFSGDTSRLASFGSSGRTPVVNTTLNGSSSTEKTLHLQLDPTTANQSVTMTTTLDRALEGLNFTLYDIDKSDDNSTSKGSWNDLVEIKGFLNGQLVNANFNVLDPNNVVKSGSTLNGIKSVGNDADGGNVKVGFGGAIDSFQLTFKQEANLVNDDPGSHGIGIGSFAVPEPMTMGGTMLALGLGSYFKKKVGKNA